MSWRRFLESCAQQFCSKCQFWQNFLKDYLPLLKNGKVYLISNFLNKDTFQYHASKFKNNFVECSRKYVLWFEFSLKLRNIKNSVVSILALKWVTWVDVFEFETRAVWARWPYKIFKIFLVENGNWDHFSFKSPPWRYSSYSNTAKTWRFLTKPHQNIKNTQDILMWWHF